MLRGAVMTPEADSVRVAMAHAAEAAFDRLARAQVSTATGSSSSSGGHGSGLRNFGVALVDTSWPNSPPASPRWCAC